MDECEHGDYAEEGWRRVDEALRREDGPCYWTTDQQSSLGSRAFCCKDPIKTLCSLQILSLSVTLTTSE